MFFFNFNFNFTEVFTELLKYGAKLEDTDAGGNNVLHFACGNGRLAIVEHVMSLDNVLYQRLNNAGKSPLQLATERNHTHIIDFFKRRIKPF